MTDSRAHERLATFAPAVVSLAGEGDPVALSICRQAGEALGESLLAAARDLSEPTLTATGRLLEGAAVREALAARIAAAGSSLTPAQGSPLDGAVHLAPRLAAGAALPSHTAYVHLR